MMEKWLLKLSKYNKNTIDLIIGKKKHIIKILSCRSEGDSLYLDENEFNFLKN